MSEAIQGNSSYTAVTLPVKRGRGRPRKDHNLKRVKTVQFPPGFEQVKANQPRQVDTVNVANDGMIGRAVTGVVEAAFDAGYLLSVRIGDSNTNFRGVVFRPGHFDPVTAENDVAPHVQMIKRNEIHLPIRNQVQVHGHDQSLKSGQLTVLPPTTAPSVPSVGARGAVVPVVLQPVNPTNGLPPTMKAPPTSSQAAYMGALKERGVQNVAPLATLPPDGSQTTSKVTQVSVQEAMVTGHNGDGSFGEGATLVQQKEVKPIVSNNIGKPVEVTRGIQGSLLSPDMNTKDYEASHKFSAAGNLSVVPERDIGDMNELPSMEPSDAVNSPLPTQATSVPKPLMNYGIGRMTELLQAVQENMMENQELRAGGSAMGLGKEFVRTTSPRTDGNKEKSGVQ
ncbi:PREDICTED: uncharacterized protein LOC109226702 isoform X1 [Nicotiana attenuata]|uniref:AT hook motif-containing protein n=1 Tax=Nicotiana attenuata TaxID=49451 RepID=A0A1J6I9Z0_NICAT|nr:PREDICTED: uncharacterized protein LOC109226702 isoform X1 [Nicotiana attenuata]XP_019247082.1 PREDICTED: uncharacterized protein LOC109226702 isoform X1 [Nicotiana attenuata]XP_019247083.1 PREDICTED: uncharacterized protein LOC109226702 isoform X1 [Nicotiana attenuata]XP_019247084.1 PREDICTED: uncharacterized protein LOC109226702 isoform X1 [Nicotiana attenuata]XP_019247085.1 PREDICTED: uncharacterized protein LOC109226702 isoform X1 [Nicotiana attenuata]OIT01845.1 hypothetical protein A4A